jgi:ABC-type nitrate/sulfonate/bicarbonate transport system substrate-binding protein
MKKVGVLLAFFCALCLLVLTAVTAVRSQQNLIPVKVELITRAVAKTPVLIAYDAGIFKKYGLNVQLWMPPGEYPNAIETGGKRMEKPDLSVDGGVPMMTAIINHRGVRREILATTDCEVRFNFVGQKGMHSVEELKGKKLGISADGAMTGFIARLFLQRMNWQNGKDITILENNQHTSDLDAGKVDAIIADDRYIATATEAGYPVLADTSKWNQPIAGSSVRVEPQWLQDPKNRDIAERFLKGFVEGVAIYFENRPEAVRVLMKYHGIPDQKTAEAIYEEGLKMERKPLPCYAGIKKTMELYNSPEMQKYKETDFYDDGIIKQLDKSGFIAQAYKNAAKAAKSAKSAD